ncbi:primase, partial [Conglomerata obtusa]
QISTYFQKLIKQKYVDETIISIIEEHSHYVKDQGMSCGTDIDTLIDLLYVKLDRNVTAEIKHLLKSPFSIHPTSYKISVPMSLDMLEKLKVAEIPVLNDIFDNCERITKFLDYFIDFNSKEYKK